MKAWHEATWVDPEVEQRPTRRFRLAWLWLLVVPAVLIAFSLYRHNVYEQYSTFTVTTLACQEPVAADAPWSAFEAAGCAPADVGAQLKMLIELSEPRQEPATDGTTWTFENIPAANPALSLDVTLQQPAGGVVVANAAASPPQVISTLSHDALTHYSGFLNNDESLQFYVVIIPQG